MQLFLLEPFQVDQWVIVQQDIFQDLTGNTENNLVSWYLYMFITYQGDISKVPFCYKILEG